MRRLFLILFIFMGFTGHALAAGFCNVAGANADEDAAGVITYSASIAAIGDCSFAPDEYQVTIYEMSLCTANPVAPSTSVAFDAGICSMVINSPAGQTINMAAGSEIALTDFVRPPNGTYTHGHMLISNSFGIKVTKQFTNTMWQNGSASKGNYCWTLEATEHASDFQDTSPSSAATGTTLLANCGNTPAPAMYTQIQDEFDNAGVERFKILDAPVESGTISAYLIKASTGLLVEDENLADRLLGIQSFTTPIVVKPDSSSFTISFGVNQATQTNMSDKSPGQFSVIAFETGPFSSFMTVE